jgi:NADPH:quinone reductase-like Zn-dependent oxidoreductase
MTEMMKAIQATEYGDASVLKLEQVERPEPGDSQVLIRLKAAGVNPADWKYRSGMYKERVPLNFPWTPGLEGAGVVEAVGDDVKTFRAGQEVYGAIPASYAEYALARESDIQPIPSGLTFEEAASLPVGVLTAWGALIDTADVQAGQKVLVQGGAGGVGGYVVQLAHWKRAHVIATLSAANLDYVRSLGADEALDYQAAPFESALHDLDVVIDTVGGDLAQRSFKVLRPGGMYVTVAGMLPKDAGNQERIRAERGARATAGTLHEISKLVEARQIWPTVGKLFPLAEAQQAQELSQTGHGRGRIILRIS